MEEKMKKWKYAVIVIGVLLFGMVMLSQEEVSVEKNAEVYEEPSKDPNNANSSEENSTNVVTEIEQVEMKAVELLKNEDINAAMAELEKFLGDFQTSELDSELVNMIWISLQRLQEYGDMEKDLKSYQSPIPKDSEEQWLDVYVTHRVKSSGTAGGYTDYYVAYPYTYIFNEPYPDYDGEEIIIYSASSLSKGVNFFYGVENGTYKTIDDDGFEHTNRLFHIYSEEAWEQYYLMMYMEERKEKFKDAITVIKEDVLKELSEKDVESAEKTLCEIGMSLYCGYWYDEENAISLEVVQDETNELGKVDIFVTRDTEVIDTLVVWTMEDARYDVETGTILYENCLCEQQYTSFYVDYPVIDELYSDGMGKIYLREGAIYWEDSKDDISTSCIFE